MRVTEHEGLAQLRGLKMLCVAGEASGDALLGPLVTRWTRAGATVFGVGGPRSVAAGLAPVAPYDGLAAHGLTEALPALPKTLRALSALKHAALEADAVFLVDFPEVSLRILRVARRMGRPVAYLAPPQAWAWRAGRAREVAQADWVGCLFDFERAWYVARGARAEWVGHPLADRAAPPVVAGSECVELAVLPGSRRGSVTRMARLMAAALEVVAPSCGRLRVHVGLAPGLVRSDVAPLLSLAQSGPDVVLHSGAASALSASSSALVGVGTATLECALAQRPLVAVGALSWLSTQVARRLVRVNGFALPNIVLGRPAFAECVGERANAMEIARALSAMLSDLPSGRAACVEVTELVSGPRVEGLTDSAFDARVATRVAAVFTRSPQFR